MTEDTKPHRLTAFEWELIQEYRRGRMKCEIVPDTMICHTCQEEKPLEDFPDRTDSKYGKRRDCRVCHVERIGNLRRARRARQLAAG